MAKDKSSFILYCDLLATVSKLPDSKAGKLFKTILAYVNDLNPEVEDVMVALAFEPIKQQMKRDLQKWERTRSVRKDAGHNGGVRSGEVRRDKKEANAKQNEAKLKQNESNEAVTVTVNVTDNVNERESTHAPPDEILFTIEHCLTVAMNDDRWVKASKATESSLREFNKFLETQSEYTKNPKDYKKHYANWIKKQGIQQQESKPSADRYAAILGKGTAAGG